MAKCLLHRYDGFDNLTGVGVFSSLFQLFKRILGNDLVDWEPTFFIELNQPWNEDLWIGVAFTTANYSPICMPSRRPCQSQSSQLHQTAPAPV